jgi:MerR family copper efflux transcriptional regulator
LDIIKVRGDSVGKLYRIGEIADESNVSKRTIDYYTKLGLLECERSESNYRFYTKEAIEDIKFIEQCKKMHMTLNEIKQRYDIRKSSKLDEEVILNQIEHVKNEVDYLQTELKEIYDVLEKLNDKERKSIVNKLSPQMLALFPALAIFLDK